MPREPDADGDGSDTGRRTFLKTVGAAGAAAAVSRGAAADPGVSRTVGDGLDTTDGRPQEAIVVFDDIDHVDRMDRLDLERGYRGLEVLPFAYAEVTGEQIRELAGWESVMRVVANREVELDNNDSQENTNAEDVWDGAVDGTSYTGENVEVAVVDSGLDAKHPAFLSSLEANYQWVGDPLEGDVLWADAGVANNDQVGHGTHCAGSIVNDSTGSVAEDYSGMAPDASLVAYQFPPTFQTLIVAAAAYDHIISNNRLGNHDIRLTSNSWTWGDEFDPWNPIPVAVHRAFQSGIVPLFSAGNDGPDPGSINETVEPFVLSVGATNADESVTGFSSRGLEGGNRSREDALEGLRRIYEEALDPADIDDADYSVERPGVVAKGGGVVSTQSPDQGLYALGAATSGEEEAAEPLYAPLSGTSMACPTTAGCVALFLDAYVEEHGEYPDPIDTINTIEATADEGRREGYTVIDVGAGHVDALAAVRRAVENDLAGFDEVDLAPEPTTGAVPAGGPDREPTDDDPQATVDTYATSGTVLAGAGSAAGAGGTSEEFTTGFDAAAGDYEWALADVSVEVDGPPGFEWTEVQLEYDDGTEWVTVGEKRFEAAAGEMRVVEGWSDENPGAEAAAVIADATDYRLTVRAATNLDVTVSYDVDVEFVAFDLDG